MKTITTIAATLLMLITLQAQASPSKKMLIFKDTMGRILTQPTYVEEATEEFPFDYAEVLHKAKAEQAEKTFNIANMSKPETFVDDIPAALKCIIRY